MGPVDLLRRIQRLFLADPFQAIVSLAAAAGLACGFIYNLAEYTPRFGMPDSWDGGFFVFTALACVATMAVARKAADAEEDAAGKRPLRLLVELFVAAGVVFISAVLAAAIVMSAIWPWYFASAQIVVAVEAGAAVVIGVGFWFGDWFYQKRRNDRR